jgi:hypothetical protein
MARLLFILVVPICALKNLFKYVGKLFIVIKVF